MTCYCNRSDRDCSKCRGTSLSELEKFFFNPVLDPERIKKEEPMNETPDSNPSENVAIPMNVVKPHEIPVYDNLYSKPTQQGVPTNHRFSMPVIYSVGGILYYGQYDFTEGLWDTLPGDEKSREFTDREVEFWFYPPGTLELFRKYAEDVKSGSCLDERTRLEEFNPGDPEVYEKN